MKKTLLMVLCVLTLALSLTACSGTLKASDILINASPKTVFYLGEAESSFKESLKDGSIKLRYVNDEDSAAIPMNDEKVVVSGFSSKTVGDKHITVTHKDYPGLEAKFSITIQAIAPVAVKAQVMPTKQEYYADVKNEDIDLRGGKFLVTYNDGHTEEVDMTEQNAEVTNITMIADGDGIVADVKVRYLGTNYLADYQVELIVPTAVGFRIVKNPLNVFYSEEPEIKDVNLDGLQLEFTKNSGKKIEINGLGASDVTFNGKAVIAAVEDGKVILKLDDTNIQCEFDYFVFDDDILDEQFIASFDWDNLTALDEEDARRVFEAFKALSEFSKEQLDANSALEAVAADIREMALYICYELATNVCNDQFIASLDWEQPVLLEAGLESVLDRALEIISRFTKADIAKILADKFPVTQDAGSAQEDSEESEERYFVDNLITALVYSDYANLVELKAEFDAIDEPELLDAEQFFLYLQRLDAYAIYEDVVLYVDNSGDQPVNVKVSKILSEAEKLGEEVNEAFED